MSALLRRLLRGDASQVYSFCIENLRFSLEALRANLFRTLLTGLGMVIGNASVILVVTISLTSRDYILEQIQGIGSNMIFAYYETGGQLATQVEADFIKMSDVEAVRQQIGNRAVAVTGIMTTSDRILVGSKEEDISVIGSDQHYKTVRNLNVLVGRFLDSTDVEMRQKVALLTEKLAKRMYRDQATAIGNVIKIHGLQFTVIGTFKERVESFGQSELLPETVLIPITVLRYFVRVERVDPMYVQAKSPADVVPLTDAVRRILESRHRPGARYRVENLTAILNAAKSIALVLSSVLILVSAIALVISGIGIMNIMLVTVTERTREIGIRMAVGASRMKILGQFLTEALLISLGGGLLGILAGIAIPLSVRLFEERIRIPISITSIMVAFAVSCAIGLVFGLLPANRASRLNPTEALRYE